MNLPYASLTLSRCILPHLFDVKPWYIIMVFRHLSKHILYHADVFLRTQGYIPIDMETMNNIIISDINLSSSTKLNLLSITSKPDNKTLFDILINQQYDVDEMACVVSDLMIDFLVSLREEPGIHPLKQFAELVDKTNSYNIVRNLSARNIIISRKERIITYVSQIAFVIDPDDIVSFTGVKREWFTSCIDKSLT